MKARGKRLFTKNQVIRLANIFDNIGQVCLATVVLPPLLSGQIDTFDPKVLVLSGGVTTLIVWWISLRLERMAFD